jgi:hypothetical protein
MYGSSSFPLMGGCGTHAEAISFLLINAYAPPPITTSAASREKNVLLGPAVCEEAQTNAKVEAQIAIQPAQDRATLPTRQFFDSRRDFVHVFMGFVVGTAFGINVEERIRCIRNHEHPAALAPDANAVGEIDVLTVGLVE